MIKLPDIALPIEAETQLQEWQALIDAIPTYEERVAVVEPEFKKRNTKTNSTFKKVREKLKEMCAGARRCCYCEDSLANAVEHFKPKSLYPEEVFAWRNYLYSCSPCNLSKLNKFAVFAADTGRFLDVTRGKNQPIVPPTAGKPVLINPRIEDPLNYMELDLSGTFYFMPTAAPGSYEYQRAYYTIEEALPLNDDDLLRAREEAYDSYCARLHKYVEGKKRGAGPAALEKLAHAIKRMHHPAVWKEMQRKGGLLPDLQPLFADAEEALFW